MKREKVGQIVRDALAEAALQKALSSPPVMFDILTIDFPNRTITFRGRTSKTESDILTMPLLSTDRMIFTSGDEVVV